MKDMLKISLSDKLRFINLVLNTTHHTNMPKAFNYLPRALLLPADVNTRNRLMFINLVLHTVGFTLLGDTVRETGLAPLLFLPYPAAWHCIYPITYQWRICECRFN